MSKVIGKDTTTDVFAGTGAVDAQRSTHEHARIRDTVRAGTRTKWVEQRRKAKR
jgi:hypothetical protein